MKYTKDYIKTLDIKTLDFIQNWIFDTYKRCDLSKDSGKTKKIREHCQYTTDGILMAYQEIKYLSDDIKKGGGNLCDTINLFNEPND